METKKLNSKKVVSKKVESKIDSINSIEAFKKSLKKTSNKGGTKESKYIFTSEELDKAQAKLILAEEKNKSNPFVGREKRKLKLSFHLSSTRQKIRDEVEDIFNAFNTNKSSNNSKKEILEFYVIPFMESRFVNFKKDQKIYRDIFANEGRSKKDKDSIDLFCDNYNTLLKLK